MRRISTDDEIIADLRLNRGRVYAAARSLGYVTGNALSDRISRSPLLKSVLEQERESFVDLAETRMEDAVEAGEPWAIKYVLDSKRGRARGWGQPCKDDQLAEADTKRESRVSVVDRIKQLSAAFEASADLPSASAVPSDGVGEPVHPGDDQVRIVSEAG